jgi:hypothetical protein
MAMLQSARLSLSSGGPVVAYIAWTVELGKVQLFQAREVDYVRLRPHPADFALHYDI